MNEVHHDLGSPVHEDSDGLHGRRKFAANVPGVGGSDSAWGFFVEIQADGPGAEFFGETGVLRASDSADFDEGGHKVRVLLLERNAWTLR